MMTIQRILHATDFSQTAKTAFLYAGRLAHRLNVPLHVLHVLPGIVASHCEEVDIQNPDADAVPAQRNTLTAFRELAAESLPEGVDVHFFVGRGSLPGPAILEEAARVDGSIIVLGAHGLHVDETPTLGSVAAELMQRSTCPVFMVPAHVRENAVDEEFRSVLTFVSYAHLMQPVIRFALKLARLFEARLDVLVLTTDKERDASDAAGQEVSGNMEQQLWRTVEAVSLESNEPIPPESIRLHLRQGSDVETILEFVQKQHSDLFIVESPGLGPVESPNKWMLEHIVNQSPCPVVLVNTCTKAVQRRPLTSVRNLHPVV